MKPEGAKLFEPSKTVSREFFDHLVSSHELGHDGFHGKDHWLRVLHNAREIAAETGANLRVLELFAVLHDCPSSDNLGQLSALSFGGSGSSLIEFMRFQFGGASAA